MKKLLLALLCVISTSASASCWITVGGYYINSDIITNMYVSTVSTPSVFIAFDSSNYISVDAPSAEAAHAIIRKIISLSRACK